MYTMSKLKGWLTVKRKLKFILYGVLRKSGSGLIGLPVIYFECSFEIRWVGRVALHFWVKSSVENDCSLADGWNFQVFVAWPTIGFLCRSCESRWIGTLAELYWDLRVWQCSRDLRSFLDYASNLTWLYRRELSCFLSILKRVCTRWLIPTRNAYYFKRYNIILFLNIYYSIFIVLRNYILKKNCLSIYLKFFFFSFLGPN